jgi:hypothetical protein
LVVERVGEDDISVTGCSSSRRDFPLEVVLNDARDEWWISAPGSTPGGYGEEYLEFSMGSVPHRVQFVSLCIPPLPHGPLSVRAFHVLAADASGSWVSVSPEFLTLDRADLQEFALVPPVDTTAIRIVCTRNAAAGGNPIFGTDCIGLFQVSFA